MMRSEEEAGDHYDEIKEKLSKAEEFFGRCVKR